MGQQVPESTDDTISPAPEEDLPSAPGGEGFPFNPPLERDRQDFEDMGYGEMPEIPVAHQGPPPSLSALQAA
jgi:hypothetical protein